MPLLTRLNFAEPLGAAVARDGAGSQEHAVFQGDPTTDGTELAIFDGDGDYAVIKPNPILDLT